MVYGYYHKTIQKKRFDRHCVCPECGMKGSMMLETICRVNHIMFIPFYTDNKKVLIGCDTCEQKFLPEQFPEIQESDIRFMKSTRPPFYYYSGFILLAAFLAFIGTMIVLDKQTQKEDLLSSVEHVRKGNLVIYNLDNGEKTCMYVVGVQGDTLLVRQNKFSVKKGKINAIDKPDNYSEKITPFTKAHLREWIEEDKLKDIYTTTTAAKLNPEIFER